MISIGLPLADWARSADVLLPQSLATPTPLTLAAVFAGGLLTSLGPCSLSLLPITLAYLAGFEAQQHAPWRRSLAFAAGIVRHMAALTALAAPSAVSYQRLKPHHWAASWTTLGEKDREATLRICPTSERPGYDPSRAFNMEFRAADATASPHLSLAMLIRAGIEGLGHAGSWLGGAVQPSRPGLSSHPAHGQGFRGC